MTQHDVAEMLGCILTTVARYETGLRMPEQPMMEKIFSITNGEVTPNDFYDLPPASGTAFSQRASGERGHGAGRAGNASRPVADAMDKAA